MVSLGEDGIDYGVNKLHTLVAVDRWFGFLHKGRVESSNLEVLVAEVTNNGTCLLNMHMSLNGAGKPCPCLNLCLRSICNISQRPLQHT